MNIPDDKEEDFDDNINFYVLCLLLGGNAVFEILKIGSGERRRFINNIFQSPSSASLLSRFYILWGLQNTLLNVMPIVIGDFYTMIDLYSVRPTVVKSVDVVTIRQRRNSDTDSNDNFHPHGVIFDEWEELEAISSSNLIT